MNIILSKVVLWGKSSFHYMEYRTFPEIAAQSFATNSICYNHEIEKNYVSKCLRIQPLCILHNGIPLGQNNF